MSGQAQTWLDLDDIPVDPGLDVYQLTPVEVAANPWLLDSVAEFESLENAGGETATWWLKERALANDGSTKTYLFVRDRRIEGYVACAVDRVYLSHRAAGGLGVPWRASLPAFIVAWVARRRGGSLRGIYLIAFAFALARETAKTVGIAAFALHPANDEVAEIWKSEPYGFKETKRDPMRSDEPPTLYAPIKLKEAAD